MCHSLFKSHLLLSIFYRVNFWWNWRVLFFSYLTTKCSSLLWISLYLYIKTCTFVITDCFLGWGGRVGISEMCVESLIVILKLKKGYILNSFYYGICSGNTSLRCISEEFCSMHLLQSFMNFLSNTCNTHLLYMYLRRITLCWNLKNYIFHFIFQEDFLATDDLFVDYFNAYLSLPVSIYTDNIRGIRLSQPWLLMNNFTPFNGQVKYITRLLNKAFYEVSV